MSAGVLLLAIPDPTFAPDGGGWFPFGLDGLLAGRWLVLLLMTAVLLLLVLPRSSTAPLELVRELLIVIPAVLLYDLVRGLVEGRESEAVARAARIIDLERALGVFWELEFQQRILDIDAVVNFMNWVYLWGFWPVIVLAAFWLFFLHRDAYPLYRNAFLISGVIGLVIYALLPVAPPRFMDGWGFVDTIALQTRAYSLPDAPLLVNQYAAMPSLHFGWVLLVGIAVVRESTTPAPKLLGPVIPAAMFVSIVATGNHFILDGVAGAAVALVGLAAAYSLRASLGRYWGGPSERVPVFASRLF